MTGGIAAKAASRTSGRHWDVGNRLLVNGARVSDRVSFAMDVCCLAPCGARETATKRDATRKQPTPAAPKLRNYVVSSTMSQFIIARFPLINDSAKWRASQWHTAPLHRAAPTGCCGIPWHYFRSSWSFSATRAATSMDSSPTRDVMPARRRRRLASATLRPWEYNEWQPELLGGILAYRLPHSCRTSVRTYCEMPRSLPLGGLQDRLHRSSPVVGANLLEPSETRRYKDAMNWTTRAELYEGPDETLSAIEQRIAKLTGIPFHDDESPLMLGETMGGSLTPEELKSKQELGDAFIEGLHHDHNQRPNRAVTVLTYITGGEDSGLVGGGTIFPCLRLRAARIADRCNRAGGACCCSC